MLLDEFDAIQNPALGAILIWRAVCGYYSESSNVDAAPATLAFIVLPLVFNEDLREVIGKTFKSSGIRKFESKFQKQVDLLFSIQERADAMLDLSRRSLAISISSGLVTLTPATATLSPRTKTMPAAQTLGISELTSAAEKIGIWAQQISLRELCSALRLEL